MRHFKDSSVANRPSSSGWLGKQNTAGGPEELKRRERLMAAPTQVAKSPITRKPRLFRKVGRRDLIDFCVQMSTQIGAGVQLPAAMETCANECESPALARILEDCWKAIESGSSLHETLDQHPKVFPPQMASILKAGELGGKLDEAFQEAGKHLEWLERLMEDVRQASIYPAFIFGAILSFVLMLFTFVIPRFMELLKQMKTGLPLITRVVFGASEVIKETWWFWAGLLFIVVPGALLARKFSARFARIYDQAKLRAPLFGPLNRMVALSRFTHTLASLHRSGIPLLEALALCENVAGNALVAQAIQEVKRDCEQGETISMALRRHDIFTSLLVRMVAVGETTGRLDAVLDNAANHYNEQVPRRVKKLFSYMEPVAILVLVGLMGVVALAVFMPIMTLVQELQRR